MERAAELASRPVSAAMALAGGSGTRRSFVPTALLRALVQIRDGSCSLPVCARHPRGTEWEHGMPWPEGRTCGCKCGLHCKRDHLLKQSSRWDIRQLPDGRRIWTAPTGLEYTSHLHDYPD